MSPIQPAHLLISYANGAFPMADSRSGEVQWYTADPRAVMPLDERFHVSRSLRRVVNGGRFDVSVDEEFQEVIRACADRRDGGTWISSQLEEAYVEMHRLGYAHSVECRRDGKLVGGLYGVAIGGAFFGESMFHLERDASKVALVHLVERLRAGGFILLDTQFLTDHLARFGAFEIPRNEYRRRLARALDTNASWRALDDA